MRQSMTFSNTAFIAAMMLSTPLYAATPTLQSDETVEYRWSAKTGLGYDSNAYRAPNSSYVDFAALPTGSNPTVVPEKQSGYFVPYAISVEAKSFRDDNNTLIGSGDLNGSAYIGSGLTNANQINIELSGGLAHKLQHDKNEKNTIYIGGIIGKHNRVYVDRDSGQGQTLTAGEDASNRYNYIKLGVEAEYKHRSDNFDYGFNALLSTNNYDSIVGTSTEEDHTYFVLGADASTPIADQTRLKFSLAHKARNFSKRRSRDAQGTLLTTNPLLRYTYNSAGITVRSRLSDQWLVYGDFDYRRRVDGIVGYNSYNQSRVGVRLLYEQGKLKTRLALHHRERDYPNGFAFDDPIGGAKTYRGNVLKLKAEWELTKDTGLWAELAYDAQTATDLRYDYVRTLVMAGMSWTY